LEGFIARTRAVGPSQPTIFRLSPDDGRTVVLQFGGDVMFGRRFFDPNSDGDPSDGLLPQGPSANDHLKLLASIQPLITDADLMVVNLESPLNDQPYPWPVDATLPVFHPNKYYVFYSHSSAIAALKQAGVDLVDLGNNHMYDLLEDGLSKTLSVLQENNLPYFGAGHDEASAWKPAIAEVGAQRIAFVGCTSVWRPTPPITANDVTYVAQDEVPKGGAARCLESQLYQVVSEVRREVDLVVVMIHGGYEYGRDPSKNVEKYSKIARVAGAALIINHHPHVVGGLVWEEHTLTAWSLGNFIFDQLVWPTYESYTLTVYVRDGQVVRAFTEPLIINNYMPHGVVGGMADFVARGAAGRIPGKFVLEAGAAELNLVGQVKSQVTSQPLSGDPIEGTIYPIPDGQWVSAFQGNGNLRLGRDLLWVGSFEPEMVQNSPAGPLLWTQRESQLFGQEFAYQGSGGIRLTRGKANQADAVTTHSNRILVKEGTSLSISGMARPAPGALTSLQVSWYPALSGSPSQQLDQILPLEANGTWQSFRVDVRVPPGIIASDVVIRLVPPVSGTTTLDLDDLRLIEWAVPGAKFGPLYTHFLLRGEGKVSFRQDFLPLPP
jgi:poly-gamma-glutamate synthesis protein (capsule biosynthesis protein)